VLHGRTGLLAEERDVNQLVAHLEWFLQHPEKWAEMAANGRHHVEEKFNVQLQAAALAERYRTLVNVN
jgi:colanic acid/amylovoran biosynthesis glycosyltransferase